MWCVLSGWADHSSNKKEMRNKRKKALVQPVTPKRKPAEKKKKREKSLAELPAELKHITQRCKKKVTTIAKVTASELAIFDIYIYIYIYIIYITIYILYMYTPRRNTNLCVRIFVYIYLYIYFIFIYIYIFLSRRPGKRKMCGSKQNEDSPKKKRKIERCWSFCVYVYARVY